ncbi:heavy metal translocating P-type ATPase [Synechocystis sp. PCC 7509]|uniref:heavy metal translocating P-type ATPase n=1 Tax=Synechocystis sp. PCC 7509 TaxID=927677 RepID=UPI0002ABED2E|nr:heavy metal translocating P-type ATPase [Synechocystis sp. PCC 7509]
MQLASPASNLTPQEPSASKTIILDITGMKCGGCVKTVEKQLAKHPGAIATCVNLVTEVAVVECQPSVEPQELAARLTEAGFPTKPREAIAGETPTIEDFGERQQRESRAALKQLLLALLLLIFSSLGHLPESILTLPILKNIWLHWGLATITLLIPGRPIIVEGWRGWRRNAPNMNTLVALGTVTAYITSVVALLFPPLGWECFFDEPVMLLGFILLGRTLEQQAKGQAAVAFRQLLALQPQLARLIAPQAVGIENNFQSTSSVEIPADQVRVGEWIQVLPGEKIPVDGNVVAGQTTIDESMLTGEAFPVIKQLGDTVTAGTLNKSSSFALQATRTGADTTLAQIVALVEAAQTRKAPVQKLADTVAGYFTYGVLAASILTFLFWYFVGTHIWTEVLLPGQMSSHDMTLHAQHLAKAQLLQPSPLLLSLKLAIAVMVVACPCAMGLATPTAILVGTGVGAQKGLLIKGGDVLEKVHKLDTVVFDKTGTLTSGHPIVTDVVVMDGNNLVVSEGELLKLAAVVESGTCHPLATAIVQAAKEQNLSICAAKDYYTEPGLGVSAVVKGKQILLGNYQWLSQNNVNISQQMRSQSVALAAKGKTVVFVASNSQVLGLIAVSDTLRAEAKSTIKQLRSMGLKVMLLSGDTLEAAEIVGAQLELEKADIMALVRPAGKAQAIQQLQAQNHYVAMVGDGINDAPALSQADVGIALKAGTEVAMEAAQIVLMRDSLSDVVAAITLSRATFLKIRQNLFWAFAYNTLGIPVAAGLLLPSFGFVLNPAAAGALMAFSSVSVVTNSLMLRRFK